MNDKSIHGFLEMWSLNAFLCEHEHVTRNNNNKYYFTVLIVHQKNDLTF